MVESKAKNPEEEITQLVHGMRQLDFK
jgi:ATP-dependent RNA helicase DDX19/DBP5